MRNNQFILGVTGVIGSGKSTLCRLLQNKHGFYWIETDKIVHDLYMPEKSGYKKIREYFGPQFAGKRGVNRGRLRQFVLKSPQKLWILNKLIHPLIVHEVNKKIVQYKKEAPLEKTLKICIEAVYFEANDLGKFIDLLVITDAEDKILLKRLKVRRIPKHQLKKIIYFQRKNLPKFGKKITTDRNMLKNLFTFFLPGGA